MKRYQGLAASDGIAIGPAWIYHPVQVAVVRRVVADPAAEWERLQAALAQARTQLRLLEQRTRTTLSANEAAIFEAHQLFVDDEDLRHSLLEMVLNGRLSVEAAVQDAFEHYAQTLAAMEDPYFRARSGRA